MLDYDHTATFRVGYKYYNFRSVMGSKCMIRSGKPKDYILGE